MNREDLEAELEREHGDSAYAEWLRLALERVPANRAVRLKLADALLRHLEMHCAAELLCILVVRLEEVLLAAIAFLAQRLKVLELVVHGDTYRLEDARRGIDAAPTLPLHARDEAAEVIGGEERLAGAAANDRGSHPARLGLLAELAERAAQLALVPGVHDVARRDAKVWVGAHVQRAFRAEAEAALRVSELDR